MNAKKLLSTLLSAAMAVSMLAGCFGGGGNKNYSDEAADAANAAQSTVVFSTDATLAKSLQDALADGLTQLDEIDDAMEADENLKPLLTSGWDLDIFAAQGEDAEAAAKTIAEQYIVSAVIGKKAEGKIAMVLHDGNGYYYVAVLTYGNGGSGSGGGAGGGSGSGDDGNRPGDDDDEEENGRVFLKEIKVTPPSTLVYVVGQEFKPEDMTIMAFYSDGSSKDVTLDSKWECSLWNAEKVFTTAGDSQVVVTYEGKKAAFSITVVPVTLTGIQVSGNYSTEYYEGEFFDNQNLVVEACYNNGDVKVVTDYKLSCDGFDGEDKLKPGKYNVVVEYEGFTAEIPISVTSIVLDNLTVTTDSTFQKEYFVGDEFDPTGMEITATYTDGSAKELTIADCELRVTGLDSDKKFTESGTQTITVTYTEDGISKSDTVTVNVKQRSHYITVTWEGDGKVYAPDGSLIEKSGTKILVEEGTPVTFKFNASDDYDINLKIDGGNLIENQSMYTFVNVTTDRTLHVIFEEKAHSVTIKIADECRGHGTVMYKAEMAIFDDEYTINDIMPDDSITFSVQADEGYSVDKVVSDQRGELLSTSSGPTDPKYTLTDVTKNETVTVYFKKAK